MGRTLRRSACLSILFVGVLATGGSRRSPVPTTLLVRVVDSVSRVALPNAEVTVAPNRRLTDARGEVRIVWPADGSISLRVRQLGFRFVQRTLTRGTSASASEDTVVVPLARAAFALPQMTAVADRRCRTIGDPRRVALSESSKELLRFGAEQYRTFVATYPFDVTTQRRTVPIVSGGTSRARTTAETETTDAASWGDRY